MGKSAKEDIPNAANIKVQINIMAADIALRINANGTTGIDWISFISPVISPPIKYFNLYSK